MRLRIDTTAVAKCSNPRCKGKSDFIIRHHMGNDRALGRVSPAIRDQYYEYNDVVTLCDDCHCEIHWIYHVAFATSFRMQRLMTVEGVAELRQIFIELCKKWLGPNGKTRRVSALYRRTWKKRVKEWRSSR